MAVYNYCNFMRSLIGGQQQKSKNMEFSERLFLRRKRLKLTQDGLAARSGVSKRAIVEYEKGAKPTGSILEKLASALDVSPAWLLGGEGPPHGMDAIPGEASRVYSIMATDTLARHLADLAKRLITTEADHWPRLVPDLQAIVKELALRARGIAPNAPEAPGDAETEQGALRPPLLDNSGHPVSSDLAAGIAEAGRRAGELASREPQGHRESSPSRATGEATGHRSSRRPGIVKPSTGPQ
jgi:transcriptional regulator with XRE-family HTH domain